MQNHHQVKAWIRAGEGQQLDFKVRVPKTEKIARTICAFANTKGGQIVVGVTDDGYIVGVQDVPKSKQTLMEAAQFFCTPAIPIHFEYHEENLRTVLVAVVKESKNKPHKVFLDDDTDQAFIRVNDKTLPASKAIEKSLLNYGGTAHYLSLKRSFSSKEKGLIEYLEKKERITAKEFMQLMNLSKRRARRMLIDLAQEGILNVHDLEKEDFYTLR